MAILDRATLWLSRLGHKYWLKYQIASLAAVRNRSTGSADGTKHISTISYLKTLSKARLMTLNFSITLDLSLSLYAYIAWVALLTSDICSICFIADSTSSSVVAMVIKVRKVFPESSKRLFIATMYSHWVLLGHLGILYWDYSLPSINNLSMIILALNWYCYFLTLHFPVWIAFFRSSHVEFVCLVACWYASLHLPVGLRYRI